MVVKWFVGQSIKQYEQTISKLEGDIKRLKDEEIEELKGALHNQQRTSDSRSSDIERRFVELNTKFVDREDYLKHQTTTDLKLDALHKRLDEMMAIMLRNKP